MQEINKILCVVDPTTSVQPAMHRAAWLAQQVNAELELFICYYNEYLSGERFLDAPSLKKARHEVVERNTQYLEKLAEPLRNAGLTVKTTVTWDHPLHEGIVRQSVKSGSNIVFKDTHHHSAMERALLTNTDWNLIRTCPAPLWLTKAKELHKTPTFVASIDPTHEHDKPASLDDIILKLASNLASKTNSSMHVFHSYDPRIALATATANAYIPASLPYEEIEKDMRELHGRRFDEVTSFYDIPDDHKHLISGATHEELPDIARKLNADVVVMGAIARNRWKRLFIGATAERTLEHVPCDLLIVKPDWFETPVEKSGDEAAA